MPNGLNSLFEGLFSGAEQVGNKLIENNRKGKLEDLYNTSLNKLNEFLNPQATYQQNGQQISRSQVSQDMLQNSQNGTQSTVQQTQTPDVKGAMNFLYQQAPKFNSEDGKGYLGLLNKFFENSQPTQPEYDIREVGGQLVRYDKNNPSNMEVVYGDKKPEKTVYNQKFYESQTPETIKNLTPDQIKEGYFYLPKELQDQLYSNPEIKDYVDNVQNQGDYTKTLGSHKSGRKTGSLLPKMSSLDKTDVSTLDDIAEIKRKLDSNVELTDAEKKKFDGTMAVMQTQYGLNPKDTQKVAERLANTTDAKEKQKIMNSLKKGDYYNESQYDQSFVDERRTAYDNYLSQLDQAYQMETNGQQPAGYFQQAKEKFYNELEWDKDNGIITLKEYNYYHKLYN